MSGLVLFPHDPLVQKSGTGMLMTSVQAATAESPIPRKVALVLAGCVVYRFAFEPTSAPTHETRYIYALGIPGKDGGFVPYIAPEGIAEQVSLVNIRDGFSAD